MVKTGLIGDQFSCEWCHFSTTVKLFNQVVHHNDKVKPSFTLKCQVTHLWRSCICAATFRGTLMVSMTVSTGYWEKSKWITFIEHFFPFTHSTSQHKSAVTHSHTHSHINGKQPLYTVQNCSPGTHTHTDTHTHTHQHTDGTVIRSNLGFRILTKGTLTCRAEDSGIKPPTF